MPTSKGHLSSVALAEGIAPSRQRPVRNFPVGAVISVWLPEQADSCDYAVRFGAAVSKILNQPYYILVWKDVPCGSNYSGLGVFPA